MNIEQLKAFPEYQLYMKEVYTQLHSLPPTLKQEVLRELNSHIYESLEHSQDQGSVTLVLQRLGKPSDFLPEWVALKKLEFATETYHPLRIITALFTAIRFGTHLFRYLLFGVLYLFTFAFAFLFVAKIIAPRQTGLFHYPSGSFAFGFSTASASSGVHELAGWWFLPLCAFISILLYVLTTSLLKVSLFKRP